MMTECTCKTVIKQFKGNKDSMIIIESLFLYMKFKQIWINFEKRLISFMTLVIIYT